MSNDKEKETLERILESVQRIERLLDKKRPTAGKPGPTEFKEEHNDREDREAEQP